MPERTVVFYECQDVDNHPPFDRVAAVQGINALADPDWRVPYPGSTDDLGVIVDKVGSNTVNSYLRFLRIRSDVPFILSVARALSPIQVAANDKVSEFTHVVLFKDGFMGALSSRDAPRHKWLDSYLHATSNQYAHTVNLYRADVVKRLKELQEGGLTRIQVKVRTSEAQQIADDSEVSGFKQLWNAGKGTGAAFIGIDLNVGRFKATLDNSIGLEAEELAEHVDRLESMIVAGKDVAGVRDTINMKKERIAWEVDIAANATDDRHYRAIERARTDLQPTMGSLSQAARGS